MAESFLYVGTYTHPEPYAPGACGAGLLTCAFDARTGCVEVRHTFDDLRNAGYLALDERRGFLFSVSERIETENAVHLFQCHPDGRLARLGIQPSRGRATCHVCVLPGTGDVCAASYLGGCITVFPVQSEQIAPPNQFFEYEGCGPNAARQEASHPHQVVVSPDHRWLYVVDLGADRIWLHALDHGRLGPAVPIGIPTPPGYGPRHLSFHPFRPRAYVLCELNGRVLTFAWEAATGQLRLLADASSAPHRSPESAYAAAIRVHPSGRALFVSDRQEGVIVVFGLDAEGQPTLATRFGSGGDLPRDVALDPTGRWLIAANQGSHTLSVFELDPATGLPKGTVGRNVSLNSPGCLQFQTS
jgi:6-phosphogluconolactonase